MELPGVALSLWALSGASIFVEALSGDFQWGIRMPGSINHIKCNAVSCDLCPM